MFVRSTLALVIAAAVAMSPATARARFYCRWTGAELGTHACQDRSVPNESVVTRERCCDVRVQTPLSTAKPEPLAAQAQLPPLVSVELAVLEPPATVVPACVDRAPPLQPPLASTEILLI
jgi:hypothetical protein